MRRNLTRHSGALPRQRLDDAPAREAGVSSVAGVVAAWRGLVELAAARLRGDGWQVAAMHYEPLAPWHVAARRLGKWRVVQVVAPGTPAPARIARRLVLGQSVRLAAAQGTMEQWLAHVRPGGRIVFGAEALYGQMWAGVAAPAELPQRLGLAAH